MEYLTVTALNKYLEYKCNNDINLVNIYLKGEISNYKHHQKGYVFFTLKDELSSILVFIPKNVISSTDVSLKEGSKVLVTGKLTFIKEQGSYRLIVKKIEEEGLGELFKKLELLKQKLEKENVFNKPKKPIPEYPKRIGVITSKTGAVIKDIMNTIQTRYPLCKIVLYPSNVQGIDAKREIEERINQANSDGNLDVIIVARGGGSIEDLWAFNEENVVRAISNSKIPIISAIGHETDYTLSDLAADLRSSTPTFAAMDATKNEKTEIINKIDNYQKKLKELLTKKLNEYNNSLNSLKKDIEINSPYTRLKNYSNTLINIENRLSVFKNNYFNLLDISINTIDKRLNNINLEKLIEKKEEKLDSIRLRTNTAYNIIMDKKNSDFKIVLSKLKALNPLRLLEKGFSVTKKDGKLIKSVKEIKKEDVIEIVLNDGSINAEVL